MNRRFHRSVAGVAAMATAFAVGACGSDSESDSGTRSVESPNGTVEIPTDPQAALGMYTTDVDVLLTLGFPLAKLQPIRAEYDSLPSYLPSDAIEGVQTFANFPEFDYETLATADPDFILNSLAYEPDTLTTLPEIAPTYSYNGFDGTPWREHFEQTARDLDRTEQYDAWTKTYEDRIAEVKEAIGSRADGLTVAPASFFDGQVYLACQAICSVYDDLGIDVYEGARSNDGKGVTISVEELSQLSDVDVLVTTKGADSDENSLTPLEGNPLYMNLPAVQNGQVFAFQRDLIFGSPSGQLALLDQVEQDLTS
ncbi:ABC transporter substrate-binding protein [Rhodococcus artemisiae]|uniref:ABC transporter substrate-binding protein n=1 Tax=Rhodococcus artemisiae TaxID=714159 RepID=A0ABU7LDS3_9NOCA|nr:ABC transporter substrate-binding protein [Rhodococcus artemisiae]MEE2059052.1 ABC transporter substrate-binding protein [Rhodococcus artemisiae]